MRDIMSVALLNLHLRQHNLQEIFPAHIASKLYIRVFNKKEYITESGEYPSHLLIIVAGRAKIMSFLENGKEVSLSYLNSLDMIGDIELLHETGYIFSVMAESDVAAIAIPKAIFYNELFHYVPFLHFMLHAFADKSLSHSRHYTHIRLLSAQSRLATWLLNNMDERTKSIAYHPMELSSYLDISERHLFRIVSSYLKSGVLRKEKKKLYVVDISIIQSDSMADGED